MASRLLQMTELPINYTLSVFDTGQDKRDGMIVDIELADPYWTAFTGRFVLPHGVAPTSKAAAALLLRKMFACLRQPSRKAKVTQDQEDFLRGLEAIRLEEWAANEGERDV